MEFESLQRHDSKTIIQTKNDIISKHSHPCRIPGNILISLFFKYLAFFFSSWPHSYTWSFWIIARNSFLNGTEKIETQCSKSTDWDEMATPGTILSMSLLSKRREIIKHFCPLDCNWKPLNISRWKHTPTSLGNSFWCPINAIKYREVALWGNVFLPASLLPPPSFFHSWCLIVKHWLFSIWKLSDSTGTSGMYECNRHCWLAGPSQIPIPPSPSSVWPHHKVLAHECK